MPELECLLGFPEAEVGGADALDGVVAEEAAMVCPVGAADDVGGESVMGFFDGATVRKN